MSDDLDLSSLTDDQVVELARLVAREIGQRGVAVAAAAEHATLDESERARIAKRAAELEAARLRDQERQRVAQDAAARVRRETLGSQTINTSWSRNRALGAMVKRSLGDGWTLTVWHRENIKRIYLDGPEGGRAVYHVTGDSRSAPGRLEMHSIDRAFKPEIAAIARAASEAWRSHPAIDCDDAADADCPMQPLAPAWMAAIAARTGGAP